MKRTLSILLLSVMSTALFADYTTYDELINIVDSLTSLKPEIIVKKSFGVTTGGRELFAVKISDNASVNEYEPEIAFDAGTHGNEVVAQEMIYRFMRELVRNYDSDTLVKRYVDSREIWIFPLISPDGRMELNRLTHGVNLNRDWGFYWSPEFLGESPFELIETRAAARWVLENRFVIHQTNHDGAVLFAYHWGFAQKKSDDSTHFTFLGNRFKTFAPYIQVGFYTSGNVGTGSMYSYGVMGSMGFTMEVHGTINPTYSDSIINLRWSTQRGAMYEMLNCAGAGIKGLVLDASTKKPLQATVNVRQIGAGILRPSFTETTNGDYHRFLAAGSYEVVMTANGYAPSAPRTLTVTNGSATENTFELTPLDRQYGYRVIMNFNPGDKTLEKVNIHEMIGAADGRTYPIGSGGFAVVDFGDTVRNISGVDFAVRGGNGMPEGYSIEVAQDWTGPWISIDTVSGSAAFDLASKSVDWFRYVKIRDDGDGDTLDPDAGLNIDAVEYFTSEDPSEPTAPYGLTGVSENFTRVKLTWRRSTDGESDIAAYEVFRDGEIIAEAHDTSFLDLSLASGVKYSYAVRAKNSRGLLSGFVSLEITTAKDTTPPAILYAYANDSTSIVIVFSKEIDSLSSMDISNYSMTGGVLVQGVELLSGNKGLKLITSVLPVETELTVMAGSITDRMIPPVSSIGLSKTLVFIPGLVGLWKFSSVKGDTVFDESGNDLHGRMFDGAMCATEANRTALFLDGVDDGMVVSNSSKLNFARGDFTIACRIYADTLKAKMAIVEKAYNSLGYRFLTSDVDKDRVRFVRGTTFTTGVQSNDLSLVQRRWIHVAAVVSAGTVTMYIDGVPSGSGALAAVDASSSSDLFVGIKGFSSSSVVPFKGKIDDLCVVNRPLSVESILWLASGTDSGHVSNDIVAIETASEGVTVSPNPFNPSASIYVKTANGFAGKVILFDISGNKVIELYNGTLLQGVNKFIWDGRDYTGRMVSSGVYLLDVSGLGKNFRKRIILSR